MKKIIVIMAVMVVLGMVSGNKTFPAIPFQLEEAGAEDFTVTSIGDFDFVSGSDGYTGTGMQIGNTYFYND